MPEKLALVCEGPHDNAVAEALVERVLREEVEGYEGNEEFLRVWCRRNGGPALLWKGAKDRLRLIGSRVRRPGLPGDHGDGIAAARAVLVIEFDYGREAHVFLLRDCDGQPERRAALETAREQHPDRSILIGFAVDRIEAWILAAFVPENQAEQAALASERANLGFDPTLRPHELTAREEGAKRDPKRVLKVLLAQRGNHRETYAELMRTVAWEHLEQDQRGVPCGLLPFRGEIRERLVPCFRAGGRPGGLPRSKEHGRDLRKP